MTPKPDREVRLQALTRLALATREKVEPQTFVVYLDDTKRIPTHVMIEACHRLETSAKWFPKVAELRDECGVVAREHQRREDEKRPKLNEPPASPDAIMKFKETFASLVAAKRMPARKVL